MMKSKNIHKVTKTDYVWFEFLWIRHYFPDKSDLLSFLYIDGTPIETGTTPTPINCQWSNWGTCSETCGPGFQTRTIQVQAQNGGTECSEITVQECNLQLCQSK